jgi:hypothetical protein
MDTVTCPHCGTGTFEPTRIVDGFATCDRCGRRAAAAHLGEQVWLEQQERLLQARLSWVRQQVLTGAPAGPATGAGTGLPGLPGLAPSGGIPVPASAVPNTAPHPGPGVPGVQALLLGAGAVLLVTAAAVFVAVTWDLLGPGGQLTSLGVIVAALSAGAHAARVRFRGTAETLAAVAACVTVVALLAAPALGLVTGWWRTHGAAWASVAFGLTAGLAIGLAAASRLIAWRVAAVAGLLAAAQSAVFAAGGDAGVPAAGPVGLAVPAALLLRLRPGRTTWWGTDVVWLGSGLAVLSLLNGLTGHAHPHQAVWWSVTWAVIAGCGGIVAGVPGEGGEAGTPSAAGTSTPAPTSPTPTSPAPTSPAPTNPTPTSPAPTNPAPTNPTPTNPAPTNPTASAAGAAVLALGLGQALVFAARGAFPDPSVWLPQAAVVGAALLATTLRPRWVLPGSLAAIAVWSVALAAAASDPDQITRNDVASFLGIVALSGYAVAMLPGRGFAAWPAAVCATGAAWLALGVARVDTLEVYTGASAGLLLLAGLLQWRDRPRLSSVKVIGAALAMAVLPSALVAFGAATVAGGGVVRTVLVILSGAVLAALGAVLGVRAPFLVGLAAALIAGLGQLFALAELLPRWVTLAAGGVLLLGAGFAAEAVRTAGRQLQVFTGRMR